MTHQHDHAAAFTRPKTGGPLVIDAHLVGRERARLGKADDLEGIEAQINSAGNGNVEVARRQGRTGVRNGEQ
ncbi:MAG TPA: hypothetical protein VNH44_04895 [Micropepsaceae bacterium]|nr:hypothetical protein [Micropepsaceae bacterium]